MKINYGKLLQKYFAVKAKMRGYENLHRDQLSECSVLEAEIEKIKQIKGTSANAARVRLEEHLQEKKAALENTQKQFEQLRNELDVLDFYLHDFTVSVDDVLHAIFPDFNKKDYRLSCLSNYRWPSTSLLTARDIIEWSLRYPEKLEKPFFSIVVKNKKAGVKETIFKFYDINERLADGSLLKDHLQVVRWRGVDALVKYRARLTLPSDKIKLLMLSFMDLRCSKVLKKHAFEIGERKTQKEER